MDDTGNPPKNPESYVYPDICSNVLVRRHGMRSYEIMSLPAVHAAFSENDLR